MSKTLPTNSSANIDEDLEKEKSVDEFAKAFVYDAKSKNDPVQVENEIKQNKFYGDIEWPTISNAQFKDDTVNSIEKQLVANNNEFTRYPSDRIHAQMCSHVYKYETITKGERVTFSGEEFVVHEIFIKYTGLIGQAQTIKAKANRVLVYVAVLYLNETRKQLVLATKSIEASIFKSHVSSHDALSSSLKGILCNETIPQLYAVSERERERGCGYY